MDERDAFADEDRNDVDAEFVDLALVEKRADQLAAAHHENILSFPRAQAPGERSDGFADKLDPIDRRIRWMMSEDKVFDVGAEPACTAHFDRKVVRLASP